MKSGKRPNGKSLEMEDRILWDMVRRTIVPRHKQLENANEDAFADFMHQQGYQPKSPQDKNKQAANPLHNKATATKLENQSQKSPFPMHIFDRPTHRKIAKGRINIDGRLDLHGLNQEQAYALLFHFLQKASAHGFRHVLVITGKGRSFGSDGILRQAVPHWLAIMPFRNFVSAFEDAALHHGGHGALYIRLRRNISGLHK